jgi:hypothetical protein
VKRLIKFPRPHGSNVLCRRLEGYFREGNQEAIQDNMTPDAHTRRMKALFSGWGTNVKKRQGEITVTRNQIRKTAKRKRIRLHMTVAKEAREIQDTARRHAAAAMKRMAEIAETSFNETAAIAAASVIFERAYGKASQTNINATVDANGKATDVSGKELDTRIAQALKRVEQLTGGKTKAPASKEQPADLRQHDRDPDSSSLH